MAHAHKLTNITQDKAFALNASQKIQRLALKLCCTAFPSIGLKVALYHFTNTRKHRLYTLMELPSQNDSVSLPYRYGHIVTHSWGSSDKIIYLVHGWESNSSWMKGFITPLVSQGYRVIAFDMPAHGRSSSQPTHLLDFSATLEYVMSVYGKAFGILAHSFGGTATVLLMRDKQHLLPKKLCLISPMKSLDSHLQVFNTVTGLSERMMDKLSIRLKQHYALEAKRTDITQLIQDVSLPGLLIHDEHDRLIPIDVAHRLASAWNDSRFIKTQSLGHRKILSDPFVIRQVTNYMLQP